MHCKGIVFEDFVNYKLPAMFITTVSCTFKCETKENGYCCQNRKIAEYPTIEIDDDELIGRYIRNGISRSIVFGGLEPFMQFPEILKFISDLRNKYGVGDDVVIYTGYNKEEIKDNVDELSQFKNITIKYGRFIPNSKSRFDEVLGVTLASDNQYAERIS